MMDPRYRDVKSSKIPEIIVDSNVQTGRLRNV